VDYTTLSVEIDDEGIALLTLNRPDALNSFTVTMGS
jgi:Enoyl-CoA hydratase/carnithine racemase